MELTLRPVQKSDADFFVKELNKSKYYSQYLSTPYPYTKKDANSWINKCLKQYIKKKPTSYSYIITIDDLPVGAISFNVIDYKNNNAELGYWLSKKHQGKGIMLNAIKMICYIAFKQLKLKRVYARTSTKNKPSQTALLKSGFKLEGKLIKDYKLHNKYNDSLIFGLVN